jgi:hypothetical protein
MERLNQDSLDQSAVDWYDNMEHVIGHFGSELDALETSLKHRHEQHDLMPASEVGLLLYNLKGWRESGEQIIELADKCSDLAVSIFREANSEATSDYCTRRAEFYERRAAEQRENASR